MASIKGLEETARLCADELREQTEQGLHRIYTLRDMGYSPIVVVYDKPSAPSAELRLQWWVNNRCFFRTVPDFYDFEPSRRGKSGKERG